LAIFLFNDEKDYYFSIPIGYIGNYQIDSFEFDNGYILIGDYKILLKRNDINIDVYVNESSDEHGDTDGLYSIVYSEKKGRVLISRMGEPLTKNHEYDNKLNNYNIFIEKKLKNKELKNIIKEYEKGNIDSHFYFWYRISFNYEREEHGLNGIYDDCVLYNGSVQEPGWFPPNLEFFRSKVLQK
jgi:hypothetical protein